MKFHFILACTLDEYTCLDGACVHLDDVCDGISDCKDKSDELNCQSIRFDATYTNNQPPLSLEAKFNKKKLPVHIEINILSVLELNEINSWMKLQLKLQMKWIDPRLKFANLKVGEQRNILSPEQKQKLWVPSLIFANNKEKMKAVFGSNSIGNIILTEKAKFYQYPNKTRTFNGKHG
jgi:hypothetical protein